MVAVNSFNMILFIVVKIAALFVFFLCEGLTLSQDSSDMLQLVAPALYVADLNYALAGLSILTLYSGIRRMAFDCCKGHAATDRRYYLDPPTLQTLDNTVG